MRLKLISCQVFCREIAAVLKESPHEIAVEFLSKGLHDLPPALMRDRLQEAVNRVPASSFDAILLGYGLCGGGTAGLRAPEIPLVLPRVHDCLSMLLGSDARRTAYQAAHPDAYFLSSGWMEHRRNPEELKALSIAERNRLHASREALVEVYGDEEGAYLYNQFNGWVARYRRLAFVRMGVEGNVPFEDRAREQAKQTGWKFERLEGTLGLFQRLVNGNWAPGEFIVVAPGQSVSDGIGSGQENDQSRANH